MAENEPKRIDTDRYLCLPRVAQFGRALDPQRSWVRFPPWSG